MTDGLPETGLVAAPTAFDAASTIPAVGPDSIPRDNLTSMIANRAGDTTTAASLVAPTGSGKSVLLAQFAASRRETCISYFIGDDLWTASSHAFLRDIGRQLAAILGRPFPTGVTEYDRLKQIFSSLVTDFAAYLRQTTRRFYFIVDNYDAADRRVGPGETIAELLPTNLARSGQIAFIVSGTRVHNVGTLTTESIGLPTFGINDTAAVLTGSGLSSTDIQRVHDVSGGLPAYVGDILRQLRAGRSVEDVLSDLSNSFSGYLSAEWERTVTDSGIRYALALVAHSPITLALEEWRTLARQVASIDTVLQSVGLIEVTTRGVSFRSSLHREFAAERLNDLKADVLRDLVTHYLGEPLSARSLTVLPDLLRQSENYQAVTQLVTPEFLSGALSEFRDLATLRHFLQTAAESAARAEDVPAAVFYSVASGLLGTSSFQVRSLEPEIRAHVALGDFDAAVTRSRAALLPEDQLQALGVISSGLREADLTIPDEIVDAIDAIAAQVSDKTPLDDAARIASRIFDTRPETAVRLIERCAGDAPARSLDRAFALLSLTSAVHSQSVQSLGHVQERIRDDATRDLVRMRSLGTTRAMSPEQILSHSSSVTSVEGQLHILRTWCDANRKDPGAGIVILRALELITESRSYTPGARIRRQVAEALAGIPPDEARSLADRLRNLEQGLPPTPVREKIRLDLILAEQTGRNDPHEALEEIQGVVSELQAGGDLDICAYGYLQAIRSLKSLPASDSSAEFMEEVRATFDAAVDKLFASSADQLSVMRRTIRVAAITDLRLAAALSLRLNLQSRRDAALSAAVEAHSDLSEEPDLSLALESLAEIQDGDQVRGPALTRLLEVASGRGLSPSEQTIAQIQDLATALPDPYDRAFSFAWAARLAPAQSQGRAFLLLAAEECAKIDEPWFRTEASFGVVAVGAKVDPSVARDLMVTTQEIAIDPASRPFFGPLISDAVGLAASGLPRADDASLSRILERCAQLCYRVPSSSAQVEHLASLSTRLFIYGTPSEGRRLAADAISIWREIEDEFASHRALAMLAAAWSEYDLGEFLEVAVGLPASSRSAAISNAIIFQAFRAPADTPIDPETANASVDFSQAQRMVELIAAMPQDIDLYWGIQLLTRLLLEAPAADALTPRQLIRVAEQIEDLAHARLPDPIGIQHDGYKILVRAHATRLRLRGAGPGRRTDWRSLTESIEAVNNVADRVVVYAWVAGVIGPVDRKQAESMLERSESLADLIGNEHDRSGRWLEIAEAWNSIGKAQRARAAVRRSFSAATNLDDDLQAERTLDIILEKADMIDPELANSLTPLVDDVIRRYSLNERVAARALSRRPDSLPTRQDPERLAQTVAQAAERSRRSLAGGRGTVQPPSTVLKWLVAASYGRFEHVLPTAQWAVDNASRREVDALERPKIADGLLLAADLAWRLASTADSSGPVRAAGEYLPAGHTSLTLYNAGEEERAQRAIRDWITGATKGYLFVVDPYFSVRDIDLFRDVPPGVAIHVVAGLGDQRGLQDERNPVKEELREIYTMAWYRRVDQAPPFATITLLGTAKGKCPIHDRYLLTEGGGLKIGTSIGGAGKRSGEISEISAEAARDVRRDLVDPWLVPLGRTLDGERVLVYTFTIGD